MAEPKKRIRRTPEEARSLILEAARDRLQTVGPEGLQVKEVAGVAGVAHSTILHHFGSAEGLRAALIDEMGHKLLEDILAALKARRPGEADSRLLLSVFETLSDAGHARLLAWVMLKGDQPAMGGAGVKNLFHELIEEIAAAIMAEQEDKGEGAWRRARKRARFTAMLAALTAVGDGIAGPFLAEQIGLTNQEARADFRTWLAEVMNSLD